MIQIDTFAESTNENCKPAFWSSAEVTIRGEDMSARVFAVVHVQLISSYFRCILAGVGECGSFWHDKTVPVFLRALCADWSMSTGIVHLRATLQLLDTSKLLHRHH